MLRDDRDAAFVDATVAAVVAMIRAAEAGDRVAMIGTISTLLAVLVNHANAPIERASDAALLHAIERLG